MYILPQETVHHLSVIKKMKIDLYVNDRVLCGCESENSQNSEKDVRRITRIRW